MKTIERLLADVEVVNQIGKTAEGLNRLAYTEDERAAMDYFLLRCQDAGLETRIDSIGNAFARWPGKNPTKPVVLCGSHLDTVRNGGPLDGTLGVFAALEAVRMMRDDGVEPNYPLELVAFACEESSRFGVATVGSKAVAGLIDQGVLSRLVDREGVTFEEAVRPRGYSISNLNTLIRHDLKAYIELHIEQGPVLEATGCKIGIVTAVAAPSRFKIIIKGTASHSGATAMSFRRDALSGAAEIILAAENLGRAEEKKGTVVTVGVCDVLPGAINVIPGEVRLQVDIRSVNQESCQRVVKALKRNLEHVCETRRLDGEWIPLGEEAPVFMSRELNSLIMDICLREKLKYCQMPSGAGHDAMNLRRICPSALIFIPSKNGISHNPLEHTSVEDITIGTGLLYQVLIQLSKS